MIIEWAVATFGERFCVTSSMADAVLAHLASRVAPGRRRGVPRHRLPLRRDASAPRDAVGGDAAGQRASTSRPAQSVAEQDATYGKDLFARDPDLCCALRKVEPLERRAGRRTTPGPPACAATRPHDRVDRAGHRLGRREAARSRSPRSPAGPTTTSTATSPSNDVLVNPLQSRRLPVDRLLAVHPPGRAGRGPAQRPLGRHRQDRVRHPP